MSEPVGYGKYLTEHDYWFLVSGISPHPKEGFVPVYTHPMRELTDGEILNIYLEQTNGNKDLDILEFAKLILKKASEK